MAASAGSRRTFLLAAIVAAGFALRIIEIDHWPLWGDEAQTLLVAQWPIRTLLLSPVDPTPGLYYLLHKLLLGPTVDAASARSISLICGTLSIPAVFWLAREARAPALLTAALVALSFPLIDYSQEARAYALLVLLVTCSAAFFIRWTRDWRLGDLLAMLGLCLLALYTHLVSIFWIGPVCLAALWVGRRQAVLPLMLFAVLATPEALRLLAYNPAHFSWLAQATPAEAGNTLSRAILPFRPADLWAGAGILLIAWRAWAHRRRLSGWTGANPGAAFALMVLLIFPMLVWLCGLAKPLFMTRTILVAVPGFLAALALLLKYEHRYVRFGVVGLYAVSLFVTGTTRDKDDWRQIAGRAGKDAVLMCQPWQAVAFRHAAAGNNRIFLHYDGALAEMNGQPWQSAYFRTLKSKELLPEAMRRGSMANHSLSPVWPIRTGQIEQMAAAPVTLGQAIALCNSYQPADRQQRYIAD